MADKTKRERKPNFSDTEMRYLLEGVQNEKDVIQCKLQSMLTLKMKKDAWSRITEGVNARSIGVVRTEEDYKKKWKDLKSASLKDKLEQKRTGGGGPVKNCPYGDVIAAIIGDSYTVDGIAGMLACLNCFIS